MSWINEDAESVATLSIVGTRLNYKMSFLTVWLLNRNQAGAKFSKFDYIEKTEVLVKHLFVNPIEHLQL